MLGKNHPLFQTQTIPDCVRALASEHPDRVFARLTFLGRDDERITYRTLLQKSLCHAAYLRQCGVQPDDVVVIILEHGAEVLFSWLGVVLMGAVPSLFAFPSSKVPVETYRSVLPTLLGACGSRWILTSNAFADAIRPALPAESSVQLLAAESVSDAPAAAPVFQDNPDRRILIQHSSGTTGARKGVALTNRMVLQQLRHYSQALDLQPTDKIASWLPLYHDMGLIACFLLPMLSGVAVTMMSPFEWIVDPAMLLRVISEEAATLCWLPNFAYNILAQRLEEDDVKGLRLSSMRAFINCSEPILAASHEMFAQKFAGNGLPPQALATCYAMAENTFAVTQGGITEPVRVDRIKTVDFMTHHRATPASTTDADFRLVVTSGKAIPGVRIRITNQDQQDLPDRQVGEIVIHSDSLFEGYLGAAEKRPADPNERWFATGDLGYMAEGHLFVTGRKKDMIIVAGKNIYPQDIDDIVAATPGVYPGRHVSFGVDNELSGTQDVVVLIETQPAEYPDPLSIKRAIAQAISIRLECRVSDIVLLPPRSLVKSTSGKISRSMNRQNYLERWKTT